MVFEFWGVVYGKRSEDANVRYSPYKNDYTRTSNEKYVTQNNPEGHKYLHDKAYHGNKERPVFDGFIHHVQVNITDEKDYLHWLNLKRIISLLKKNTTPLITRRITESFQKNWHHKLY